MARIDSDSVGDPARFRTLEGLEQGLGGLPAAPRDRGGVALVVVKREGGLRETPGGIQVTPDGGVQGDAWGRVGERNREAQIAVMQRDLAELIANGQALPLSGDNLFLELDLSAGNLPPGSRVRVGAALLEVTPLPHNGCRKFRARFGGDALRFVSKPEWRGRNLRGIYMRVVEAGEIACGDRVEVAARSAAWRGPAIAARGVARLTSGGRRRGVSGSGPAAGD